MWELLQILGGFAILIGGVKVFRGLKGRPSRPGFLFGFGRFLRRLAGVIIVLLGFLIALEGTPWMTADICLDFTDDIVWCTDPEPFEAEADGEATTEEEADSAGDAADGPALERPTPSDKVPAEEE